MVWTNDNLLLTNGYSCINIAALAEKADSHVVGSAVSMFGVGIDPCVGVRLYIISILNDKDPKL